MSGEDTDALPPATTDVRLSEVGDTAATQCKLSKYRFDWTAYEDALVCHEFGLLSEAIEFGLDTARNPVIVNWVTEFGIRQHHVMPLFHFCRNLMRYSRGRVPSADELTYGTYATVQLLLRVAQDVSCCKFDIGRADRDGVYKHFVSVAQPWICRWGVVAPAPAAVAKFFTEEDGVRMIGNIEAYPLPTWAACFQLGGFILGTTWSKPAPRDTLTFERLKCTGILTKTRTCVTRKFMTALAAAESWTDFFPMDFTAEPPTAA